MPGSVLGQETRGSQRLALSCPLSRCSACLEDWESLSQEPQPVLLRDDSQGSERALSLGFLGFWLSGSRDALASEETGASPHDGIVEAGRTVNFRGTSNFLEGLGFP